MIRKASIETDLFVRIDKEYDEIAALKQAEDENKRIQSTRKRQQELRQLFYHQATTNRFRVDFHSHNHFDLTIFLFLSIANGQFLR